MLKNRAPAGKPVGALLCIISYIQLLLYYGITVLLYYSITVLLYYYITSLIYIRPTSARIIIVHRV